MIRDLGGPGVLPGALVQSPQPLGTGHWGTLLTSCGAFVCGQMSSSPPHGASVPPPVAAGPKQVAELRENPGRKSKQQFFSSFNPKSSLELIAASEPSDSHSDSALPAPSVGLFRPLHLPGSVPGFQRLQRRCPLQLNPCAKSILASVALTHRPRRDRRVMSAEQSTTALNRSRQ